MKKCPGCGEDYTPRHPKDYRCEKCYAKMGRKNKRKGNHNEGRFAIYLNEQFKKYGLPYVAKRVPRSGGIADFEVADIMFKFLPSHSMFSSIHFENKDTNQWDIQGWHDYAEKKEKENGKGRHPILIIRKPNSHDEYAVMRKEYLVELLINIDKLREIK